MFIRAIKNPHRSQQRLGFLKYLVYKASQNDSTPLKVLGEDLAKTLSKKINISLNNSIEEYVKNRLRNHSKNTQEKIYMELQDLYLSDPKIPSKTGKLYSYDSQKRYPYFLSSLGFARERTYSLLVRGKVFLQFVSKDEINSFNNYTPNHNPLLLNDYQKYVFLYFIVENDGALLNFTLTPYFIELGGRVNLGEGALDFKVYEAQDEIFIFSPDTIDVRFKKKIETKFLKITKRPIKPIFEEVKMKDRQELDSAILEALGLDPKVYLPKIYEGLCELVRERLELPKVRKKARKTKTKRDIEKLKEDVIREILPEGVKKFPEDFWDVSIKRGKFKELDLPDQPLEISQPFLGEITISSKNEFTYKTRNPSEAKYLKYAHYNSAYRVKIPVEPIFILKTVSAYERYIRDLKNRLFEAFYNRIHDQKLSHNLTQSALEALKLPEIQSK